MPAALMSASRVSKPGQWRLDDDVEKFTRSL
jgi:hypothetical protein